MEKVLVHISDVSQGIIR